MNDQKNARLMISQLLEKADGTWFEFFMSMYNDKHVKFNTDQMKQKVLKNKYSEKTYRKFSYILYWFFEYAKPNYQYENITFIDWWLNGAECKRKDDIYVASFRPKDGIYVPISISKQFNPDKQTLEEYQEYERKHRIHWVEPVY